MTQDFNWNGYVISVPIPPSFQPKHGGSAGLISIRHMFLYFASLSEDRNPKHAAILRNIASHYGDVYPHSDYPVNRDINGDVMFDIDNWDEISTEEKVFWGNRNTAIAHIKRISSDLEMMDDSVDNESEVTRIRNALAIISYRH